MASLDPDRIGPIVPALQNLKYEARRDAAEGGR